jgi:hypothetical protein
MRDRVGLVLVALAALGAVYLFGRCAQGESAELRAMREAVRSADQAEAAISAQLREWQDSTRQLDSLFVREDTARTRRIEDQLAAAQSGRARAQASAARLRFELDSAQAAQLDTVVDVFETSLNACQGAFGECEARTLALLGRIDVRDSTIAWYGSKASADSLRIGARDLLVGELERRIDGNVRIPLFGWRIHVRPTLQVPAICVNTRGETSVCASFGLSIRP